MVRCVLCVVVRDLLVVIVFGVLCFVFRIDRWLLFVVRCVLRVVCWLVLLVVCCPLFAV